MHFVYLMLFRCCKGSKKHRLRLAAATESCGCNMKTASERHPNARRQNPPMDGTFHRRSGEITLIAEFKHGHHENMITIY